MPNPTTITIGECRLSYCNVFKPMPPFNNPGGEPTFSVTVLVPKSNLQAKAAIDAAINAAIEAGVTAKWNGIRPPVPAICVHGGDGARPSDGQPFGQECKGHWVFSASCKADRPPFVVDGQVQKIINPAEVYSGCYANVNVNFFAYNQAGKKGIGCGLNGIQKTRDGAALGSTVTAEEAFSAIPCRLGRSCRSCCSRWLGRSRSACPAVHSRRLALQPRPHRLAQHLIHRGPRIWGPLIFDGGRFHAPSSFHRY